MSAEDKTSPDRRKPGKKAKPYSVKCRGEGLSLKERYRQFRLEVVRTVLEIDQHDPKMANSARRLLSVQ